MKLMGTMIGGALLAASIGANAGFYASTAHSRGNCAGFNESITWNWNESHWWEVKSLHIKKKGVGPGDHQIWIPMTYTWRAAAFDWGRDPINFTKDSYWVQGYHFYMAYNGKRIYDVYTQSGDCSGYDGWWDKHKANGQ